MLVDKLKSKQGQIGVIGMGYVGIPLAVAFAEKGFRVTGFDVVEERVTSLNTGESYIGDIPSARLQPLVKSDLFCATTDFSRLAEQSAIIIAVPTPLNETRDPDLRAIKAATEQVSHFLQPEQLVVLESTTYPGTTEEVLKPILEKSGLRAGHDFYLAYSPERIDPGSNSSQGWAFENTPKVVGGFSPACLEVAIVLYSQVVQKVVPVSSTRIAEMSKLFENIFRVVNVALVNEMSLLCDRMELNFWEVLEAANTKPYGIMRFMPGPGVGGHCIPVDPFYLTWKAREYDFNTRFIELAGEINLQMPRFVRELIIRALSRQGKPLYGAKILLLGVAYKKDVADIRESPALKIIELLQRDGALVSYNDPYIAEINEHNLKLTSVGLSDTQLNAVDCVVIVTDHSTYDMHRIVEAAKLVVDTRNATKSVGKARDKIMLL